MGVQPHVHEYVPVARPHVIQQIATILAPVHVIRRVKGHVIALVREVVTQAAAAIKKSYSLSAYYYVN